MGAVPGTQLSTYNPFLPITTSTTAATQNLIVYPVSAAGVEAGITNAPVNSAQYYDGVTHFKNIAGINSLNIGPAGSEIPLTDKQGIVSLQGGSATVMYTVCPYSATLAGYWTQVSVAPSSATVGAMVTVYSGNSASGGSLATLTGILAMTAGGIGDTYNLVMGTPSTVIAGGQPICVAFSTSTAAFTQCVTLVFTRVGI